MIQPTYGATCKLPKNVGVIWYLADSFLFQLWFNIYVDLLEAETRSFQKFEKNLYFSNAKPSSTWKDFSNECTVVTR